MAKFSRGSQLSSDQRQVTREQRKQQIAERNRAVRREKTRGVLKVVLVIIASTLVLLIIFKLQFLRFDQSKIEEPYRTSISTYFSENPLKKSQLFFSAEDLNNYITNKHPDIRQFTVSTSWIGQTKFEIEKKKTAFHWLTNGQGYLGDDKGVVYETSSPTPSSDNLPIRDGSNLVPEVGDKVIPISTLEYISDIDSQIEAQASLKVEYYTVPQAAREIHIYLVGKPYFIKFSLDRTVAGQLAELQKVSTYLDASDTNVSDYIDLRTEDKAYYQ